MPKVFVIDDEECIRDSIKWFLEDLGYDVETAPDPTKCIAYHGYLCSKKTPCAHAIIIDHNMPGMTGIEFVEHLSKRGCKAMLSNLLIISGDVSHVDMEKARRVGCTVVQKPVSLAFLKKWLENIPMLCHP